MASVHGAEPSVETSDAQPRDGRGMAGISSGVVGVVAPAAPAAPSGRRREGVGAVSDADADTARRIAQSIKEADEQALFRLLTAACDSGGGADDAMKRFAPLVKRILQCEFNVHDIVGVEDYNGDTCLHYASGAGHSLVLRFFYHAGLMKEIDQYVNRQGDTPLHDAVRKGQVMMVKQLIFMGSDAKRPNKRGETPMSIAKKGGLANAAELIAALKPTLLVAAPR